MDRAISIVSLLVSIAAVTTALLVYINADTIADAAVQRREAAMVEKLKPKMLRILADFDSAEDVKSATTLDALFAPLFKMATSIR